MMISKKMTLVILVVVMGTWLMSPSPAAQAQGLTQEVKTEAERYKALGAAYSARGFAEFPDRETPYYGRSYGWHKLTQDRFRGRLLYEDPEQGGVAHTFACGRMGTVYLELWLPGGEKGGIPFAWQDLFLTCRDGGQPAGDNPLYLDIDGDGRPEIKFAAADQVSSAAIENGLKKRVFKETIIPAWVRKLLGGVGGKTVQPGPLWIEPYYGLRKLEP